MGRLWRESRRPEDPVDAYKDFLMFLKVNLMKKF